MSRPVYLVFSQAQSARLDLAELLRHVRRFFPRWELEVLSDSGQAADAPPPEVLTTEFELRETGGARRAQLSCTVRSATPDDRARAVQAEERGRAGGMAALAARCGYVVEVVARPSTVPGESRSELGAKPDEASTELLTFCAMLASVTLGPVLPPDGSTLFGVRGARERAEALAGGRTLLR